MKRKSHRRVSSEPAARRGRKQNAFLVALGDRVRTLRARRGLTRKALASEAEVSERHLANLETGVGNPSVLVLRQIAIALDAPLAELLGDETACSPEWLMIRRLLGGRGEQDLKRARTTLAEMYADAGQSSNHNRRIALVGLRGAGKSTLGRMLADDLELPFVELSREIERIAGCSLSEVHALYGASAYRRYERRALEEVIRDYPQAVIATPGGVVSDAGTFHLLLSRCLTIWLQASPEEHMNRVVAQGDLRPMAGHHEAMEDLKRILAGRHSFYAKADLAYSTSGLTLHEAFAGL
ncbi:MAG TPA: helix-turn-helix transcriptional regulator, partial [Casimicrobiaceae bacterium]|nr:helix-turn-helix transcriptional regulator [Casimicrobiaceae bacterium]